MTAWRMVCVLLVGVFCQVSAADYATGFESPQYTVGNLHGQDGWTAVGFPGVNVVSAPTYPAIGQQSLRLVGYQIASNQFTPPIDAPTIDWAWYLDSSTFVSGGPYFTFYAEQTGSPASAMFDLIWRHDGMELQYSSTGGWLTTDLGAMPMDQWVAFRIDINPITHAAELTMNGDTLFSWQALSTTVNSIGVLRNNSAGDGNVAYLDDIHVAPSVTPEPTTFVLLALAGMALRRR